MNDSQRLSENDRTMIELLFVDAPLEINQLIESLGVTATAVRQRLSRLMALGLVQRVNVSSGRGRPVHQYSLSEAGRRSSGNNLDDLAVALWKAVQQIPDSAIRQQVISSATERLADGYRSEVSGDTVSERMESISHLFGERDLPVKFNEDGSGLPVITVAGCLYPGLSDGDNDICELEQQVLERVVGERVRLCKCQLQGDKCCSFETLGK